MCIRDRDDAVLYHNVNLAGTYALGCVMYLHSFHAVSYTHLYKYLKGETTSTNSVATIFAWSGALRKRGQLDGNQALVDFADKLEAATISTIEGGVMTGDLAAMSTLPEIHKADTEGFLRAIDENLRQML